MLTKCLFALCAQSFCLPFVLIHSYEPFCEKQMEMSGLLNLVMEKVEGLTKEVQQLRRENQQLRLQLL